VLVKGVAQGWVLVRAQGRVLGLEREPVKESAQVVVSVCQVVLAQVRVEVLEQGAVRAQELVLVQEQGPAPELAQELGHLGSQRMHFPHSK
jgi:hypothetical protein